MFVVLTFVGVPRLFVALINSVVDRGALLVNNHLVPLLPVLVLKSAGYSRLLTVCGESIPLS